MIPRAIAFALREIDLRVVVWWVGDGLLRFWFLGIVLVVVLDRVFVRALVEC